MLKMREGPSSSRLRTDCRAQSMGTGRAASLFSRPPWCATKLNGNNLSPYHSANGKAANRFNKINILKIEWRPLQMYEELTKSSTLDKVGPNIAPLIHRGIENGWSYFLTPNRLRHLIPARAGAFTYRAARPHDVGAGKSATTGFFYLGFP